MPFVVVGVRFYTVAALNWMGVLLSVVVGHRTRVIVAYVVSGDYDGERW